MVARPFSLFSHHALMSPTLELLIVTVFRAAAKKNSATIA